MSGRYSAPARVLHLYTDIREQVDLAGHSDAEVSPEVLGLLVVAAVLEERLDNIENELRRLGEQVGMVGG